MTIASVTRAAGAAPGPCGPENYTLTNPNMPVNRTLTPGETVPFAGATLGFTTTTSNQDACQGATLDLLYTVG